MKLMRIAIAFSLLAAMFILAVPALAQCSDGDPDCPIDPPQSRQVSINSMSGETSDSAVEYGHISPIEASVPMPLPNTVESDLIPVPGSLNDAVPTSSSSTTLPSFDTLSLPMYYQDPEDVSCGVQALGMALSGLEGSAPSPNALLNFLSGQGMLYEFGTGVEELAHAAQSFGYAGSLPFHDASFADLSDMLERGLPPVVALGSNGAGAPGHFVTVTGISPDGEWVAYNDPALGRQVLRASDFNQLWALQGHSGVFVAPELKSVDGSTLSFTPWVALAAGLMAIISQTPLALSRLGIGGKLESGASGGSLSKPPYPAPAGYRWERKVKPRYKTVWKQDGWTYENKTVPKYEKVKVQVGTTTVYDKIPRMKTVKVQDGWDIVEKVVPRMVSKRVQVGTTTVYDKIPQYKTVRVQDGWKTVVDRVRTYKTVRYVKYYRTTRQRKAVYRYRWGRRYFAGYRYVTKRTPVYGTKRVFNGYKRVTRRVPNYVTKRIPNGFKVVATEVPKYETRLVQAGWQLTHERVPHMVEKRVQDGWKFVPQEVPKYEWRTVQVGWTTEKYRVPRMVSVQERDGYDVKWELERTSTPIPTSTQSPNPTSQPESYVTETALATPQPEPPPTPEPTGTIFPVSHSTQSTTVSDETTAFFANLVKWATKGKSIWGASGLAYNELPSGYYSVSAPLKEAGEKLGFRLKQFIPGTRYSSSGLATASGTSLLKKWAGGLKISLGIPVAVNLIDYGVGEQSDTGINSNEFAASTAVDVAQSGLTGLAAAGLVAGGVAIAGAIGFTAVATAPLWALALTTAAVGVAAGVVVNSLVDTDKLKEDVAEGFGTFPGIIENAKTIVAVGTEKVSDAVEQTVQNAGDAVASTVSDVTDSIAKGTHAATEAVMNTVQNTADVISGFVESLFGSTN